MAVPSPSIWLSLQTPAPHGSPSPPAGRPAYFVACFPALLLADKKAPAEKETKTRMHAPTRARMRTRACWRTLWRRATPAGCVHMCTRKCRDQGWGWGGDARALEGRATHRAVRTTALLPARHLTLGTTDSHGARLTQRRTHAQTHTQMHKTGRSDRECKKSPVHGTVRHGMSYHM